MQIEFINIPPNDSLLITPETRSESEELKRWNNCVLSAKYDHPTNRGKPDDSLLIVKEI